jgi:hypothetical protein
MTRVYLIHPTLLDWELIAQPPHRFLPCGGENDVCWSGGLPMHARKHAIAIEMATIGFFIVSIISKSRPQMNHLK